MTSTIIGTKNFTVDLTKAELDSIQKQFLDELDEMLDTVHINQKKSNLIGRFKVVFFIA